MSQGSKDNTIYFGLKKSFVSMNADLGKSKSGESNMIQIVPIFIRLWASWK